MIPWVWNLYDERNSLPHVVEVMYGNTLPPELDNVQPTFFTAAARIKIQKNTSGSYLKPLEAR
jgi:hypothetical protein